MSALTILAIVAGILLAVVVAVGVTTAVKTQVMQNRDLELAEVLAGDGPPLSSAPRARGRSRVSQDAGEQRSILEEAARRRNILEDAVSQWERLATEERDQRAGRAAWLFGQGNIQGFEQQETQGWSRFIYDLIQAGRRPYAGLLLLGSEPYQLGQIPVDTLTWYRDQLLRLHPAYLATRASLSERVTQLTTLMIRMEQIDIIPTRRRLP